MAGDIPRAALLSSLDATWDNLKRLARLELKAINPVAAVLNLLPLNWDARIVKVIPLHGILIHRNDLSALSRWWTATMA